MATAVPSVVVPEETVCSWLTLTASVSNRQFAKDVQGARTAAFYNQVLQHVRALPGVESAGSIDRLPFQGGSVQPFAIEGRPAARFSC